MEVTAALVMCGTGLLALLLVEHARARLLAGLAFSVGSIALALTHSELFIEDFPVPVSWVIARPQVIDAVRKERQSPAPDGPVGSS